MTKIQNILKQFNIRPSKKLGQNFLIDRGVLGKIIQAADLKSDDIVLEIGPGLGILTIELAKRAKRVISVEKDRTLCQILEDILKAQRINNVKVVNKDILQMSNYSNLPNYSKYKLVANLPYYITSPVIRKFLEIKNPLKLMVLMVQKEVGQRICARPQRLAASDGGRAKPLKMNLLAVAVQFYAKPEIISYVSKKSFYPQPKVDSAIIKITPQPSPKINTKNFFNLVKTGFSSKRKMLKNNLKQLKIKDEKLKIIFKELGLNPKSRAENLSIKDWLKLFHKLDLG